MTDFDVYSKLNSASQMVYNNDGEWNIRLDCCANQNIAE